MQTERALRGGRFSPASRETYVSDLSGLHYSILGYPPQAHSWQKRPALTARPLPPVPKSLKEAWRLSGHWGSGVVTGWGRCPTAGRGAGGGAGRGGRDAGRGYHLHLPAPPAPALRGLPGPVLAAPSARPPDWLLLAASALLQATPTLLSLLLLRVLPRRRAASALRGAPQLCTPASPFLSFRGPCPTCVFFPSSVFSGNYTL